MHLKSLSLRGFKSFADETKLEFGPGLTAIVGPNGSGKSNVVDALLWAMGERSAKTLRGHSSTDVIFNGTSDRKPLGMAEIALTFDNACGTLPLKFPEVQVTRRVFRDGESDYLINGQECRLRDVLELFLDTGLGGESYAVVTQRDIDGILSARPEERRALIEGAAGVQKYRARRNETRRKLERVEADLLRVEDIIHELSGQIGPLEEAARLAREYEGFAARLRSLQLGLLARDHDAKSERLSKNREQFTTSNESAKASANSIAELEARERELDALRRHLESALDELRTETTDVVSRLKAGEGEVAVARERRRALSEQQEFQASEIGLLRARAATTAQNLAEARSELETALQSGAALNDEAARAEAKLSEANARLSEAARELQTRQARVLELLRTSQKNRELAAGGRASREALLSRASELESLLERLAREKAEAERAQDVAQNAQTEAQARAADAQKIVEAARAEVEAARKAAQEAAQNVNAQREKRSSLASRLKALRELEASLEGVQGGARAVLASVQRGELPDVYTLVADAVRAPKGLEVAVEIALGAGVHNLITPSEDDAKRAIQHLKRERGGRATFLPLPTLRPSSLGERTRQLLRERAVVGLASELVEFDAKFRAAVEYLLGRVVVVETLDDATYFARKCENGARLVTLEGELVLPSGALTGGQGRHQVGGLLARKRELDELEADVLRLEADIARAESNANAARELVAKREAASREAGERANEARAQVARAEREAEHTQRETRRAKLNLEAATGERDKLRAQSEAGSADFQAAEAEAARLELLAREAEESAREAEVVVATRQADRESVASGVSDTRATYGAMQERLTALRRRVSDGERAIRETQSGISSREENISRAQASDEVLVAREAELVARVSELGARREELESRLTSGRDERTKTLAELEGISTRLRDERGKLREIEDERHRAEVRLASLEAELSDIERRFGEEFSLQLPDALLFRDAIPDSRAAREEAEHLRAQVAKLGTVNVGAIEQFAQMQERLTFLQTQRDDLNGAKSQLDAIIVEVDGRTREQFLSAFAKVSVAFEETFARAFDGGTTQLTLTTPDNVLETGVDLKVQLPGKGKQDITLLSGGERALTALAFMLALLKVNPSPFVVLDEVDAPLDQANIGRFANLLREFTHSTQFIVITHNSGTMQAADVLYGVTMQKPGVSTLMSVRLIDSDGSELANGANGAHNGHANGVANGIAA